MPRSLTARDRIKLGLGAIAAPYLAGLGAAAAQTPEAPAGLPALRQLYADRFLIGAAVSPFVLNNPEQAALLASQFDSLTAENHMKPSHLARANGEMNWEIADAYIAFAEAHNMKLRGHTLLWHTYGSAADWFFEGGDPRVIRARLETYIRDVVTHFRGKVYAWDVVNEVASLRDGEIYRNDTSRWYQAFGPDYIEWAFRAAREADPDVQLFINDFDTEEAPKRARLMAIVDDLQAKNVPLDGIGHQFHVNYEMSVADCAAALQETDARGLINHVTELDVSIYSDPASCFADRSTCAPDFGAEGAIPAERLSAQAQLYRDLFELFLNTESLKSVTLWGLTDATTWLNGFPTRRTNAPLLFDRSGAPKPSFWEVVNAVSRPS